MSPLFVACWHGDSKFALDVAKVLLQHNANPNKPARDKQGKYCAPLFWACEHGSIQMAELLLDSGAKQGRGTETTPFRTVTRDPDIEKLLGEYASGERVPFRKNSSEIQRILQELEKMPHILKELANIFGGKSLSEVLEEENSRIIQPCLLAALTVFLPNLREEIQGLTSTPLGETQEEVNSYLEALIKSGVATDAHREMLYLLGNTGTGKTSLTETYKAFFNRPEKIPEPFLTEDHPQLQNTKIADIHGDTILPKILSEMIHQRTDNNNNVLLISFESSPNEQELEKAFLKIVDFGGHQVRETS